MTIVARVAAQIFNTPLLVAPGVAELIATALADRLGVEPLAYTDLSRFVGKPAEQRLGNGETRDVYRVEDGAALINVFGELVNRGAWIGASSGLTSYEGLDAQLLAAGNDPTIRAIVLDVNSPGGAASGAMETAALVRRVAQDKPVVAFVNAQAASAAYAIASGATRIVATPSAMLGSIGVVWMHVDRSGAIEKSGVKPTLLTAGAYKADGHPFAALPADARARIQAQIDGIYDLFVSTVAAHRNLDPDAVRGTEAGLFMGQAAVKAGLADAVGTLGDVFAFLNKDRAANSPYLQGANMTDSLNRAAASVAAQSFTQAQLDAIVADARASGYAEGVSAGVERERTRVAAILDSEAANGRAALARHFAFKTSMSPDDAAAALAAAPVEPAAPPAAAPATTKQLLLDRAAPDPKIAADAESASSGGHTPGSAPWDAVASDLNKQAGLRGH
jgi:capsid assembly protease